MESAWQAQMAAGTATSAIESERKYRRGLSILFSGLLWPLLQDRKNFCGDMEFLLKVRYLRTVGTVGVSFLAVTGQLEPQTLTDEGRARCAGREVSRHELMSSDSLLGTFIKLAFRELLREEGLVSTPSGNDEPPMLGLPVLLLDHALQQLGWEPGSRRRSLVLKELTDGGWVELLRGDRWYRFRVEAPRLTQAEAAFYNRFQFLSMLEQTVVQRQVGCPGFLWFVGFIESSEGLEEMRKTIVESIEAWLATYRVPLWCVRPGEEDDLVWIRTGFAIGARQALDVKLSKALEDELLYTIGGGIAARLGLGTRVRWKLQRAVADRIRREAEMQEGFAEKGGRCGAKQYQLDPKTAKAWAKNPSFENSETLTFQEQRLREAVKQVHDVLHERFPQVMTLPDLMDAARASWPRPLVDAALLEKACQRLMGFHLVAIRSVTQPFGALPVCGYKALKIVGIVNKTIEQDPEGLIANLRRFREMLNTSEQEYPPQFFAQQVILRRADVPAFMKMVEFLRATSVQRHGVRHPGPPNEISNQLNPGESLMVLQCSMDPLGPKRPHSRYT